MYLTADIIKGFPAQEDRQGLRTRPMRLYIFFPVGVPVDLARALATPLGTLTTLRHWIEGDRITGE